MRTLFEKNFVYGACQSATVIVFGKNIRAEWLSTKWINSKRIRYRLLLPHWGTFWANCWIISHSPAAPSSGSSIWSGEMVGGGEGVWTGGWRVGWSDFWSKNRHCENCFRTPIPKFNCDCYPKISSQKHRYAFDLAPGEMSYYIY